MAEKKEVKKEEVVVEKKVEAPKVTPGIREGKKPKFGQ